MPNLNEQAIRVENYRDVIHAFGQASKKMERDFKGRLREAAEPVRSTAERLAGSGVVDNLDSGDAWTKMRIGVTRTGVYVAPRERGRRTRSRPALARPNLKPLMLDEVMGPTLDRERDGVVDNIRDLLGDMHRTFAAA